MPLKIMCFTTSNDPGSGERKGVVVRELLAADVEGIEGVRAVGAVFEEVFFLRYATKAASR